MRWQWWFYDPANPAAGWQWCGEVVSGVQDMIRFAAYMGILKRFPGATIFGRMIGDGRIEQHKASGNALVRVA